MALSVGKRFTRGLNVQIDPYPLARLFPAGQYGAVLGRKINGRHSNALGDDFGQPLIKNTGSFSLAADGHKDIAIWAQRNGNDCRILGKK